MPACPSSEQLTALINGRLEAVEQYALDGHVTGCVGCQDRLETLSADTELLSVRGQPLRPPVAPSPDFVERLYRLGRETLSRNGGAARPVPLATPAANGCRPLPGVPGYAVHEEISRGGMGVVYRAHHLRLDRPVALKMLRDGALAGREERERFLVEARAVARLHHPNVVQIFEVGEHDGLPFLALEYVEGPSLNRALDGKPQPSRAAARLVATLARAVHHAHQRGIIHRDLKPANVLLQTTNNTNNTNQREEKKVIELSPSGAALASDSYSLDSCYSWFPKIADFGLAKHLTDTEGPTRTGDILGTPSYMAPEQASGDVNRLGTGVDVHALGAILYACLTGRPPFESLNPLDTLVQVVHQEPPPPRRAHPAIPRDLETICLKCLEKDPDRRYASAAALAEDLERYLANQPIAARPVGAAERLIKWARRRPAVAALSAALVLVALVGFVLVAWKWREALGNARAEAEARRQTERLLARATFDRAALVVESGEPAQGLLWLVRVLEMARRADDPDLERVTRAYLAAACAAVWRPRATLPHQDGVTAVAFSPDGRLALTGCYDRTARLWDTRTAHERVSLAHTFPVWSVAFSADGRTVVTGSGSPETGRGELRVWDVASAAPRYDPVPTEGPISGLSCDPGSRRVLFLAGGQARTAELAGGEPGDGATRARVVPHAGTVLAARLAPDGSAVATAGADATVRFWDADTFAPVGAPLRHDGPVELLAFTPDGNTLATASRPAAEPNLPRASEVRLWDVKTGRLLGPLAPVPGHVRSLAASPDGQLILVGGALLQRPRHDLTGFLHVWDVETRQPLGTPNEIPGVVVALAFSPDGRQFVTGADDHRLRLWTTATRVAIDHSPALSEAPGAVAFSPDGRLLLASGSEDKYRAQLWEVPPGTARPLPLRLTGRVMVSPDGKSLLVVQEDGSLQLWDLPPDEVGTRTGPGGVNWQPRATLARGLVLAEFAWFSPDARTALIATADGLRTWDLATAQPLGPAVPLAGEILAMGFRPDGRVVVVANRTVCARYDTRTGAKFWESACPGTKRRIAFHPDGRSFLVAGSEGVQRFDAETGQPLGGRVTTVGEVYWADFSPDGRCFAAGGTNKRVQLFDTMTGRPLGPPLQHQSLVGTLAFSPDGGTLLTTDLRTARLWDVATRKPLGPPLQHPSWVYGHFLAGPRRVFTAICLDSMQVWDVPPPWEGDAERLRLQAEVLSGLELDESDVVRVLSPEEWAERRDRLDPPSGQPAPPD